ncbi:MAG: S8 family peptidase [Candidatus Woesearchaeota archaeon]
MKQNKNKLTEKLTLIVLTTLITTLILINITFAENTNNDTNNDTNNTIQLNNITNISNITETNESTHTNLTEKNTTEKNKEETTITEDTPKYLPGFNLKIPTPKSKVQNNEIRTSSNNNIPSQKNNYEAKITEPTETYNHNETKNNNAKNNNKNEFILILHEPEDLWSKEELKKYYSQRQELLDAMKNYVQTDFNNTAHKFKIFNALSVEINDSELNKLKENPLVKKIETNFHVHASVNESRNIINSNKVADYHIQNESLQGKHQTICVLDTGINYEHEDLGGGWRNKVIAGHLFLGNNETNCTQENPTPCMDDSKEMHGTHVAGIIAANGQIKGIAPDAKLAALRVLDYEGKGNIANIIKGIEWCINNSETYNITVISMSFGTEANFTDYCDEQYQSISTPINIAITKNITVVAATGNDGNTQKISAPACIKNVTRVSSTTKNNEISTISNLWRKDLLLAPGSNILSTTQTEQYAPKTGTSMATPHVSGAIAILNQYARLTNETKTPKELFNLLNNTGTKIMHNPNSNTSINYSLINIKSALDKLINLNIQINSPKNQYYNTKNITFNITYNEKYELEITHNNITKNYTNHEQIIFDEGLHEIKAEIKLGNKKNQSLINFTIDITPPTINITSITNKTYNEDTLLLVLNATDNFGVNEITYNYNGTNQTHNTTNNTNTTNQTHTTTTTQIYTTPINITFNEGNHTITAWAKDYARNINTTNITFEINTPPKITIHSPNKTYYNTTEISLNLSVDDITLNETWFNYNGTNTTYTTPTKINLSEGEHTIIIYANDSTSLLSEKNKTIIIDKQSPEITIITPQQNAEITNTNPEIRFMTQDNLSPNLTCIIKLNNNQTIINATNNETYNLTIQQFNKTQLEAKEHIIEIICEDLAGNTNTTSRTFKIIDEQTNIQEETPPPRRSSGGGFYVTSNTPPTQNITNNLSAENTTTTNNTTTNNTTTNNLTEKQDIEQNPQNSNLTTQTNQNTNTPTLIHTNTTNIKNLNINSTKKQENKQKTLNFTYLTIILGSILLILLLKLVKRR